MTWLAETALNNAIMATILAVIVWMLSKAIQRPAVTHALWVLVVIRLVTPPIFEIPVIGWLDFSVTPETSSVAAVAHAGRVSSERLFGHSTPNSRSSVPDIRPLVARQGTDLKSATEQPTENLQHPAGTLLTARNQSPSSAVELGGVERSHASARGGWGVFLGQHLASTLLWGFVWVWLAGSLIWFVRSGWRARKFERIVSDSARAPFEIQQQVDQLMSALGCKRRPEVWLVEKTISPMLWAYGTKARLLFPARLFERLDNEARATLIFHELAHFVRGDHWIRRLEFLASGFYWWLPTMHWARHSIEVAEEECCDAWVVDRFQRARRYYAEALLDTIDFISESQVLVPPIVSRIGYVSQLQKRLTCIMTRTTKKSLSWPMRLSILLLALTVLPIRPVAIAERGNRPTNIATKQASRDRLDSPALANVSTITDKNENGVAFKVATNPVASNEIWALAIAPDKRSEIRARNDGRIEFYHRSTGQIVDLTEFEITSVNYSPDSQSFATGGRDRLVRLWSVETGQQARVLGRHPGAVRCVVYSPDGNRLASGAGDGSLKLWDLKSTAGPRRLLRNEPCAPITALCFSLDGATLVAATGIGQQASGEILLWNVASLSASAPCVAFPSDTTMGAMTFHPCGNVLVTGDWNGRVTYWDIETTKEIESIFVRKETVQSAAFSPDSHALINIDVSDEPT